MRLSTWPPRAERPDPYDLGSSGVPLAGATVKSGWCTVFAKYSLVMDATMGTSPPRLSRLPATSRGITCVVLEHAMVSYSSLWQGGRHVWQIRHDISKGREHLEAVGDLPLHFENVRDGAVREQRAQGKGGADLVFDVPVETAAMITGYHYGRALEDNLFTNLQTLVAMDGNVLTKLSQPPKWWQVVGSIRYD
jgi:hypothetical protein